MRKERETREVDSESRRAMSIMRQGAMRETVVGQRSSRGERCSFAAVGGCCLIGRVNSPSQLEFGKISPSCGHGQQQERPPRLTPRSIHPSLARRGEIQKRPAISDRMSNRFCQLTLTGIRPRRSSGPPAWARRTTRRPPRHLPGLRLPPPRVRSARPSRSLPAPAWMP